MSGEFQQAGAVLIAEIGAALEKGAAEIMGVADILVPKDTETLLESGRIFPPNSDGITVGVTFGYGFGGGLNPKTGNAVDTYAVPVHEILEVFHEPPTSAKFLEKPLWDYAGVMETELSAELRIAWGRRLSGGISTLPGPGSALDTRSFAFGGGYSMRDLTTGQYA